MKTDEGRRVDRDNRRKIPRFSSPNLLEGFKVIRRAVFILSLVSLCIAIFELGYNINRGGEYFTRGLFFFMVFIVLPIIGRNIIKLIDIFLSNESENHIGNIHQLLAAFIKYIAFAIVLSFLISLVVRL